MHIRKKNPRVIRWTAFYRRLYKGQEEAKKAKKRKQVAKQQRAYVGASIEVIRQKRAQKPEQRDLARQEALREIKKRKEKKKVEKKTPGQKQPLVLLLPDNLMLKCPRTRGDKYFWF